MFTSLTFSLWLSRDGHGIGVVQQIFSFLSSSSSSSLCYSLASGEDDEGGKFIIEVAKKKKNEWWSFRRRMLSSSFHTIGQWCNTDEQILHHFKCYHSKTWFRSAHIITGSRTELPLDRWINNTKKLPFTKIPSMIVRGRVIVSRRETL